MGPAMRSAARASPSASTTRSRSISLKAGSGQGWRALPPTYSAANRQSTHSKKNIPLSLRNAINGQGSRWRGRSSSTRTALHRMPRRGCSLTATCSGTRRGWAPLAAWPSTIRTKTLTGGRLPTATLRSSGPCPTGCATNMRSSTLRARRSNPLSRIRRAVQRSRRSLRKRR